MLIRHKYELSSRLERVIDIGAVEIRNEELLRWYDQQRVTKNIWRDMQDRWEELEQEAPLLAGSYDSGWLLIWGEGLAPGKDAWLQDIRVRAGRDLPDTIGKAA